MNGINNLFRLLFSAKIRYVYAGLRRRFIFYFSRRYFDAQMAKRKSRCSLAGHCCRITMPWCIYFKNGKCAIYHSQPFFCKIFPIDERDKELSDVKELCGYYFE